MASSVPRFSKKTLEELAAIAQLEKTTLEKAMGDAVQEYLEVARARQAILAGLPAEKPGMSAGEIDDLVHDVRRKMTRPR